MRIQHDSPRQFTGMHMLCVMIAFFGIIIAVNITMASLAGSTWSGLVVKNSYVAGQDFNRKLKESQAQRALAWKGALVIDKGEIAYGLIDAKGQPLKLTSVHASFRHPVYESADWSIDLVSKDGGTFSARHGLRDGVWTVTVESAAGLARPYRDVRRVNIRDGAIQ